MSDYDYLNEFIAKADQDDREGDHVVLVSKIEEPKTWDDGGVSVRVKVTIPSASNAEADLVLPPKMPTKEEAQATEATMNGYGLKMYRMSVGRLKQLADHYGVSEPGRLQVGQTLEVKIAKTKVTQHPITGAKKGGWPRVIAILPPGSVQAKPASNIPY